MPDPVIIGFGILVAVIMVVLAILTVRSNRRSTDPASGGEERQGSFLGTTHYPKTTRQRFIAMDQEFKDGAERPAGSGMYLVTFCDMDAGIVMAGKADPPPRWCTTIDEAMAVISASNDDEMQIAIYDQRLDLICFTDGQGPDGTHEIHYRPTDLPTAADRTAAPSTP